jgi:peptide/nickel transport system substrate-binding protein
MSKEGEFDRFIRAEITRGELLRRFGLGGAALAIPGLLAACGGDDDTAAGTTTAAGGGEGKRGGIFRMARNEEPLSFDPLVPSDNGSIWVLYNMFDQLTTVNDDSSGISPSLAESWEISEDGRIYTFTLRQGVSFSNGDPMTADDVAFSIQRAVDPKKSAYSFLFGPVDQVRKVDDATVEISLKQPFAPLLENLNVFPASIVPKKVVEADPDGFAQNPVGTGPFALKEFKKGQQTHLVRNEQYWKEGRPFLDEVIIPYVTDDNTRILKLQAGEIDAAVNIPYAQIEQIDAGDETDVQIEDLYKFEGIWLNNAKEPLDDLKVRQALNHATDKEAIIQSVLFGNAEVANHMMPKMKYWRDDVEPYAYDIDKAKQLMADSKAASGFSIPLIVPTGDSIVAQVAQIVKESWAQIGVTAEISNLDVGTAYTNFSNGNYTAGNNWYITSDVTAPDELAAIQFDYAAAAGTKSFFTNYNSPEATKLVNDAASATDEGARGEAFGKLQEVVMRDAPMVALYFTKARTGLRTDVKDFKTVKTAWWRLEDVWLDR